MPRQAINAARFVRDKQSLSALPPLKFSGHNLRSAGTLDLPSFWRDEQISQDWTRDLVVISSFLTPEELEHGVNPGDRRAIYSLVRALKPQRFLEVGTHVGVSTLFVAAAMKANGGGHITTVDIYDVNDDAAQRWKEWGASASPRDLLAKIDCDQMVTFSASGALAHLAHTTETYDMIFLDGDHSAGAVYQEMAAALHRLNPGGVILLHDFYPQGRALFADGNVIPGPFQAARRIEREMPDIQITPLGALPWPTKQGSHTTTLALALRRA